MPSATVRIRPETHAKLKELAKNSGLSMPRVLEEAIEAYLRQTLLDDANRAFARLRADRKGWADEQAERAEWDATLADGLGDD